MGVRVHARVPGMHWDLDRTGWFGISGAAGTHLPVSLPGGRRCGTDLTGWLVTPHPGPGEPIANGTVCFGSTRDACVQAMVPVRVCSCRNVMRPIYLYQLSAPRFCFVAYCGDSGALRKQRRKQKRREQSKCAAWYEGSARAWSLKCKWTLWCASCAHCLPGPVAASVIASGFMATGKGRSIKSNTFLITTLNSSVAVGNGYACVSAFDIFAVASPLFCEQFGGVILGFF
jgi:hypothetical protein